MDIMATLNRGGIMKRVLVLMVMLFCMCGNAWGLSTERSGLIYYPTTGPALISMSAAIESRGVDCIVKLTNNGSGVSTPYVIPSDVTFSELVTLEFENGAQLVWGSGVTNTMYPDNIKALPGQQVFDYSGGLIFPEATEVSIGWWTDGSAADSAPYWQQATDAMEGTFGTIRGQGTKTYTLNSALQYGDLTYDGSGCTLYMDNSGYDYSRQDIEAVLGFVFPKTLDTRYSTPAVINRSLITNFNIVTSMTVASGTGPTYAVTFGNITNAKITNCNFTNTDDGIHLSIFLDTIYMVDGLLVDNCRFYRGDGGRPNGSAGIWMRNWSKLESINAPDLSTNRNMTISNCYFESNAKDEFIAVTGGSGSIAPSITENVKILNCRFKYNRTDAVQACPNIISVVAIGDSGATVRHVIIDNIIIESEWSIANMVKVSIGSGTTIYDTTLTNVSAIIHADVSGNNISTIQDFDKVANVHVSLTVESGETTEYSVSGFKGVGMLSNSSFTLPDESEQILSENSHYLFGAKDCGLVSNCTFYGGIQGKGSYNNCTIIGRYPTVGPFIVGGDRFIGCDIYSPNDPTRRIIYLTTGDSKDFKFIGNNLYDSTTTVHSGQTSPVFFTTDSDVRPIFNDNVFWTDRLLCSLTGDAAGTAISCDNNTVYDQSGTTFQYNTDYCPLASDPWTLYGTTSRMFPVGKRVYVSSGVTTGQKQGWVKHKETGAFSGDWLDLPDMP